MGWVIRVEDWAEIRRLHGLGLSMRAISRQLGVARDTVARALASPGPPVYSRPPVPSGFDPFEPAVLELLRECPSMPASVLAERVGWQGSASWFRKRVAPLRVGWARVDPADRLEYLPGDQAQCDLWFPPVRIPLGRDRSGCPPVLVIALSHSRFLTALMLPTRTTGDLLAGMWSLLAEVGGVPRRLVWDNEAGIGRRGHLAEGVVGFAGTLATRIVQLKPFDPESKGIVEQSQPVPGDLVPARPVIHRPGRLQRPAG
jgi:transposase